MRCGNSAPRSKVLAAPRSTSRASRTHSREKEARSQKARSIPFKPDCGGSYRSMRNRQPNCFRSNKSFVNPASIDAKTALRLAFQFAQPHLDPAALERVGKLLRVLSAVVI